MNCSHTIYTEAIMNVNMGHVHSFIFIDNLNFLILIFICHPLIQLFDNRYELWHYLFQISQRPLFQGFGQNRVICIGTCPAYDFDSFIHRKSFIFHKNTNQLRYDHRRMCIVNLNHCVIVHPTQIIFLFFHFPQYQLCRIADHKILLIDTKKISRFVRIIRI